MELLQHLWSRQLKKLAGRQRWEPGSCSQQARLKSWVRALGFFASSKLWVFGCVRAGSGCQDSHQTPSVLCLHGSLQGDQCQLGG